MTQRLVSVGDDFNLPPVVNVVEENLPDRLSQGQLTATYADKSVEATVAAKLDKTQAAISYAPKIIPGSDLIRSMVGAAAMATPPTLTASTAAPAGMTVTKHPFYAASTYWPGFRISGAPLFQITTQNIAVTASSGNVTYTVPSFGAFTLPFNATASQIQDALRALPGMPSILTVTGTAPNFTASIPIPVGTITAPGATITSSAGYFPRNARKTPDIISAWGGTERIEFDFDGQAFAFRLQNVANAFFRIFVDERPHMIGMAPVNGVTGATGTGTNHYKVDLGSRAYRRIQIEWAAQSSAPTSFSGIVHAPTDTVFPPSIPSPRVLWIGDSYPYGIGATANNQACSIMTARLLGFSDIWNFAAFPSTGVTKTDTSSNTGPYNTRLDTDVIPYVRDGDIIFYQNSLNDAASTAAAITAQATADLTKLKSACPNAKIIALSPLFVATPPPEYLTVRTAGGDAAAAAVVPYVDLLSQSLKAFTGTGTVAAPTGDGNADYYRHSDGVHPVTEGHLAIARFLAAQIAPLIGQAR